MLIETKSLPRHLRTLTRKRRVIVFACPLSGVKATGTEWDEGSISTYCCLNLSTGGTTLAEYSRTVFAEDSVLAARPGFAILQRGRFRGQPSTPILNILPDDFPDGVSLPGALMVSNCPEFTAVAPLVDWLLENGREDEADRLRKHFLPAPATV